MNFKTNIIIIALVVLLITAGFVYQILNETSQQEAPSAAEEGNTEEPAGEEAQPEAPQETVLVKEGFELTLPPGWQELPDFNGGLLMAFDAQEEVTDELTDFRTNLIIRQDDLQKYSDITNSQEYAESVKNSLAQEIDAIEFIDEGAETINGNNAYFIELETEQEEVDYATLIFFIADQNNLLWALSFNSYADSWPAYQQLFHQMAASFKTNSAAGQ